MQTSVEYEELEEHLERILVDTLKIAENVVKSLQSVRLIPKLSSIIQQREFLIERLLGIAKLLKSGAEYNLPMLIDRAERIGLGLEGQKSKRRMRKLTRSKRK